MEASKVIHAIYTDDDVLQLSYEIIQLIEQNISCFSRFFHKLCSNSIITSSVFLNSSNQDFDKLGEALTKVKKIFGV